MKRTAVYVMACVSALYGSSGSAATVVPYSGNVFVSQGAGFQQITGSTLVKAGDSVMVSPDGLAQIHLDDGNVVTVSPGQVLNVPAKAGANDAALPTGAQATADLAVPPPAYGQGAADPVAVAPAAGGIPPGYLLLGAAGVAGGLAAILAAQGGSTSVSGPPSAGASMGAMLGEQGGGTVTGPGNVVSP